MMKKKFEARITFFIKARENDRFVRNDLENEIIKIIKMPLSQNRIKYYLRGLLFVSSFFMDPYLPWVVDNTVMH